MTKEPNSVGSSPLSWLNKFWVSRVRTQTATNERLLLMCSEHWIKLVFPTILFLLLGGASVILSYKAIVSPVSSGTSELMFFSGILVGTVAVHWYFWFLLAESQIDIILTSKRFVNMHSDSLWKEDILEIAFEKMKTVEAHTTNLLQTVLNYGTLEFEGKTKVPLVPRPGAVARQIEQAMGLM